MRKSLGRIITVILIGAALAGLYAFDLLHYLSLNYIKTQQQAFADYYALHKLETLAVYATAYIAATALSLPGATVLTLLGGALFGLGTGVVVISFASSIGATLAFLAARSLLRDLVTAKFGDRLSAINEGIRRDGSFYLFSLRLVPLFPFFMINLVMGLTPIRTLTFYWVSQLGMLPGTLVYVNAGTQLAKIDRVNGIISPTMLISFALLGLFPLLAKRVIASLKKRHILRKWPKPRRFDFNIIVIGAGSGGLVSAYIAAAVKAKVALIEKRAMGGDCLNTGCVPSKALIRTAKAAALSSQAKDLGFKSVSIDFDFADVMDRVQKVIKKIAPHDSIDRYQALGVDCIQGAGRVISPYEVGVNGQRFTARNLIIATGGSPLVPQIPGLHDQPYYTSDTIWNLRTLPRRLLIIGGGPIGCELAQSFQRLGSSVTIVEMAPSLLSREDADVSTLISDTLCREGVTVLAGHKAKHFTVNHGVRSLIVEDTQGDRSVEFDEVLLALGRRAHTQGFGLEDLGVRIESSGTIEHDEFMRTNFPNIYCVGDVAGPYQFTHVAAHQAWYAAVNALFSPFKSFKADYRVIPRVTFTDPEIATVGLTEKEAAAKNIPYELTTYGIDDLDRAIADSDAHGLVKVLTVPGKDKILGATVVGTHAGEYFVEFVTAMKHGIGLNKILGTIHAYPTFAEANKYAAGVWKKAHAPEGLLRLVARFHSWRRGT